MILDLFNRKRIGKKLFDLANHINPGLRSDVLNAELAKCTAELNAGPAQSLGDTFWQAAARKRPQTVLEPGTLQAVKGKSTHSRAAFPYVQTENYIRLDIEKDEDVDVVGDLHSLPPEWTDKFDAFLAVAVWEHLERPWVAAKEMARVLAPGGIFMVSTHQAFPLHGYPYDFFRFSDAALRLIFEDAGLVVDDCRYQERCLNIPSQSILPSALAVDWNREFPSYIHVTACGHKP